MVEILKCSRSSHRADNTEVSEERCQVMSILSQTMPNRLQEERYCSMSDPRHSAGGEYVRREALGLESLLYSMVHPFLYRCVV